MLDTLYITTSRLGHTPAQQAVELAAGALFSVKLGVIGIEDALFAG
jgi:sugar lactone lactonase YvrE